MKRGDAEILAGELAVLLRRIPLDVLRRVLDSPAPGVSPLEQARRNGFTEQQIDEARMECAAHGVTDERAIYRLAAVRRILSAGATGWNRALLAGVSRSSADRWVAWFENEGVAGLVAGKSPGRPRKSRS